MCLLFAGTAASIRSTFLGTPGLIEDVYQSNSDGFGFMWCNAGGLKVIKKVVKSADEVRRMFESIPNDDRMVAGHARMRTHGVISNEQSHPYKVSDTTYLAHNGILRNGNAEDQSKSDTYLFIKNYLSTMHDDALHNPQFIDMLGDYIGNNRFAIMSSDGRLSIVNKDQGVEHGGVWFSNTYAWSPEILMPEYAVARRQSWVKNYDWMYQVPGTTQAYGGHVTKRNTPLIGMNDDDGVDWDYVDTMAELTYDDVAELVQVAVNTYDEDTLTEVLREQFDMALDAIMDNYDIDTDARYNPLDHPADVRAAVTAWTEGSFKQLRTMKPACLAQALLYCCEVIEVMHDEGDLDNNMADLTFARGAV